MQGVYLIMKGLDVERLVFAGGPLGILQACLDVTLPYCVERKQFGQRLGDFQLTKAKLADMYTATEAARSYLYSAAAAADAGRISSKDCAAVILFAAENATRMALHAIQLHGGNGCGLQRGRHRHTRWAWCKAAHRAFTCLRHAPPPRYSYINEYPTGRLLRDAKLYEIGAGTSGMRQRGPRTGLAGGLTCTLALPALPLATSQPSSSLCARRDPPPADWQPADEGGITVKAGAGVAGVIG